MIQDLDTTRFQGKLKSTNYVEDLVDAYYITDDQFPGGTVDGEVVPGLGKRQSALNKEFKEDIEALKEQVDDNNTLSKKEQVLTINEKDNVIRNIFTKNPTEGIYIGKSEKHLKLNINNLVGANFDGFVDHAITEQSSLAEVPDNIYFDRTNNRFIASKGEGLRMKYYISWLNGEAYMAPNSGTYFKNGDNLYQWNGSTLVATTVSNVNILTQADFDSENTIYVIRYDYDLNNQTITIPENCVLQFDGGSLSNGCLQSNKNIIINSSVKCLDNITFGGQCVYSFIPKLVWYIDKYPTSTLDNTIDNTSEVRQCINCGCRSVEFPIDRFIRLTDTIIVNKPVNIVTNNSNVPYLTPISVDKTTERLSMRPCIFSNVVTTLFDFNLHNFVENENYNNAFTIGNITLLSTVNFTEVTQESVATPILRIKSELENGGTQKFIDLYCHVGASRCNVAIDEEDKTDGGDTTYSACNFTGIEVIASNSSISFLQVHGSIEYCFIGIRLKRAQNNDSDWFNDVILYGNTHCCFGCISDAGGKLIVYGTHQSMRMPTRLNTWNGYIEAGSVFLYGYVWDVHGNYIKDNSHKMLMAKSQCYNRDIYANGKFYVEPNYSDNKLPSQYMPNPTIITKHITGKNDIREMSNILYQGVNGNGIIKDLSYKIKFNDEAELIESLFTDRIINSYCLFNDHVYHNPRISGDRGYSYITNGGIDTAYVNKQLSQIQVSFIIQTKNTLFDNYYYPLILLIGLPRRSGAYNSFDIIVKTKDKDSTEYTTILNSSNNEGLEFGGMYYKFDITKLGVLDDIEVTITFNYSGDTNVMKRILPFISIPWPFGDVSKYRYFTDGKRPVVDAYNKGVTSFNADDNKPVYWTGTRWVDGEGFSADALRKGTTSERPIGLHNVNGLPVGVLTSDDIGFQYYDTTIDAYVYALSINAETGEVVWGGFSNVPDIEVIRENAIAGSNAMSLLNNGLKSISYSGVFNNDDAYATIYNFRNNPIPSGTKFINNGEIPLAVRSTDFDTTKKIDVGQTYISEFDIESIRGAGTLGNYSIKVIRHDNLENLLKDVASKDSVNGIYTKSEIDAMLSNVVSPFRETSEDGFFLTDSAGNIALKYDSNGLDFAMLSEHAKQLIKSANELSYNVVDE